MMRDYGNEERYQRCMVSATFVITNLCNKYARFDCLSVSLYAKVTGSNQGAFFFPPPSAIYNVLTGSAEDPYLLVVSCVSDISSIPHLECVMWLSDT